MERDDGRGMADDEPSLNELDRVSLLELQGVAYERRWGEVYAQINDIHRSREPKCPGCGRGVAYIEDQPFGEGHCYACGTRVEQGDA